MNATDRHEWLRSKFFLALLCSGLLLGACATKVSLRDQIKQIPAKHLEFYDFDPTTGLSDRVGEVPSELLALYSTADETELRAYRVNDHERERIEAAAALLPSRHQEILGRRLVAIYSIENLVGSGLSDWILGPDDEIYAILVLHPRVFDMTAAELLTLRLNTAFGGDESGTTLLVDIPEQVSALTYIMLHEATHIVDYVERHTPYVELTMLNLFGRSSRDTSFTDEVWLGYREIAPTIDFTFREQLEFYQLGGAPVLMQRDAEEVLSAFARTPFASLYGALSWAEDFAEFVTFYYLSHRLGVDYSVRIIRDGQTILEYEPMSSSEVSHRSSLIDPDLLRPVEGSLPTKST